MKLCLMTILMLMNLTFNRGRNWNYAYCIRKCGSDQFDCNCQKARLGVYYQDLDKICIPSTYLCDGWKDCPDGSDESDCFCSEDEFQCSYCNSGGGCDGNIWNVRYQCIPLNQVHDGSYDCLSFKHEPTKDCHQCDGRLDCPYLSPNDEANCSSCPWNRPKGCDCNKEGDMSCTGIGYVCYHSRLRCNKWITCTDTSDEVGCPCGDDEFKCNCYSTNPVTCEGYVCIPMSKQNDGKEDCPDGSDESWFYKRTIKCGQCDVTIRRLSNVSQCNEIGFPSCDNSTCYLVPFLSCSSSICNATGVICTSYCDDNTTQGCKRGFLCDNGGLALNYQFCNGNYDCNDGSDEIQNSFGFKCVESAGTCVLPQSNLHDDVAHCIDGSDVGSKDSFFHCLDRRLIISNKQVCDKVFDCYDLSDECLCEANENNSVCNAMFSSQNSTLLECFATDKHTNKESKTIFNETKPLANVISNLIQCRAKRGKITAFLCDGRPECRDFSDECNCENPPLFCNDSCHTYLAMGDRYCDGFEDDAWMYLNKSDCPKGFDEKFCLSRFRCKVGINVSISIDKVCDENQDCDDGSDEKSCPSILNNIFSSETELIQNIALRSCFWIMGFVVVSANFYVIITTIHSMMNLKVSDSLQYQNILLLNISVADFIMGIYLLIIAIYSAVYSGFYGKVANEWRTSLRCSIFGSLAIISSEASCLMMVLLTGFRLYKVCNPITSLASSTRKWKFGIALAWLIAIGLAIAPILPQTSPYFVYAIWLSNRFANSPIWSKRDIEKFACRLAKLSNMTIDYEGGYWKSTRRFLQERFQEYVPQGELGYYSETSVCMPRFYTLKEENAWEYSFAIITINFLSFLFIAVSYVLIYIYSNKVPAEFRNKRREQQEAVMRRRISRIIITDFLCWIPICNMAFMSFSGIDIPKVVYIISAAVLLPINSALNPILYSSLPDKLLSHWKDLKNRGNQQPVIDLNNLN